MRTTLEKVALMALYWDNCLLFRNFPRRKKSPCNIMDLIKLKLNGIN